MRAASSGHTEVALALIAHPIINVNHANVSNNILTSSPSLVGA